MAVKIRLRRMGQKKAPFYRIVVLKPEQYVIEINGSFTLLQTYKVLKLIKLI